MSALNAVRCLACPPLTPGAASPVPHSLTQHWHFLGADYAGREEEVLRKGPGCCDSGAFFDFFVNQDMYINPDVFLTEVVDRALAMVKPVVIS